VHSAGKSTNAADHPYSGATMFLTASWACSFGWHKGIGQDMWKKSMVEAAVP